MNTSLLQHVRYGLELQRQNLMNWLATTPAQKRQVRLGPADEQAVQAHLRVLDTAIEQAEDQTLGLCTVCHDYIEPSRLEMDYTACVCLDHLSAEEKNRLELELELSARVQRALLPQQVPQIAGLDLAAYSRPADIVGGDYFDFFRFRDEAHGLVIGDVAGHGMSTSLLMASLQASLRTLALDYEAPAEVVQRLNLLFRHNVRMTSFVTLFVARFDPDRSELTYCNAGHNPPLLRSRSNGKDLLSYLRPTGAAIGLVEEFPFWTETVTLAPGDLLFFYTDGISEAMDPQGREFGRERLADLVRDGSYWSAQELVQTVRGQLHEFTRGQPFADDTTLIVCKVNEWGGPVL